MSAFTGDYKEYASNADSKYSIAFAEADLNCVKGVRLYPNGTTKKCGYETIDMSGQVAIEYTDYCYQHPFGEMELDTKGFYQKVLDDPKKYMYPDPLYYDKGDPNPICPTIAPSYSTPDNSGKPRDDSKRIYMTGKEYAALGCCKVLEDLPVCLSTEMRVDIFPSVDAIGIPDANVKIPDCPMPASYIGECRKYEAHVFSGDKPSQTVKWSVEGVTSDRHKLSSTDPNGDLTYYKAELCVADDEINEFIRVQACSTFDLAVCGFATIRLKPRIVIKTAENVDGIVPCQTIEINAYIFGGGAHQELELTITGGATDTTPRQDNSHTHIQKIGDNKYSLIYSCIENKDNIAPLVIRARDINGYDFIPELEPSGDGGSEVIEIPKKWMTIEGVGTPACTTCPSSATPPNYSTSPGTDPCYSQACGYKAYMNWGLPCGEDATKPRKQNISDKVTWTLEGASNSNSSITVSGSGDASQACYRRGGNRYGTTPVVVDTIATEHSGTHSYSYSYCCRFDYDGYCIQPLCDANINVPYTYYTYENVMGYELIESCEPAGVKIVATTNENLRGEWTT
jgi:hypothetical protein